MVLSRLIVVFSTAILLIYGHRNQFISRTLSIRPFVWFGLLSYSLYIWHWPIIVIVDNFADDVFIKHPVFLLATIIAVSSASYYLIELPVRRGTGWAVFSPQLRLRLIFFAYFSVMILSSALAAFYEHVYAFLYKTIELTMVLSSPRSQTDRSLSDDQGRCYNRPPVSACHFRIPGAKKLYIATGDSFVDMQSKKLKQKASSEGADLFVDALSGCPLILDLKILQAEAKLQATANRCNDWSSTRLNVYRNLAEQNEQVVFIWAIGNHYEVFEEDYNFSLTSLPGRLVSTFDELLSLKNSSVIAMLPFPQPPFHVTNRLQKYLLSGEYHSLLEFPVTRSRENALKPMQTTRSVLLSFSKPNYSLFDSVSPFCTGSVCKFSDPFDIFVYDTGHLSRAGVELIWDKEGNFK